MALSQLSAKFSWHTKILGLAALLLSFGILVGAGAGYFILAQDARLQSLINESQERGDLAMQVGDSIVEVDRALQIVIAASGKANTRAASIAAIAATSSLDEQVHNLKKAFGDSSEIDELAALLEKIRPTQMQAIKAARRDEDTAALEKMHAVLENTTRAKSLSNELSGFERDGLNRGLQIISEANRHVLVLIGAILLAAIVVGVGISLFAARLITKPLDRAVVLARRIGKGDLSSTIDVVGSDETSQLFEALCRMQTELKEQIEEERIAARENERIKSALDNVSANVMMVNSSGKIRYFNEMMTETLIDLPGIDPANLIDEMLIEVAPDSFTANILESLVTNQGSAEIEIANRIFECRANKVVAGDGDVLGTVIEWSELTFERAAEQEIDAIVTAARAGDLSKRIDIAEKVGSSLTLGTGVNELIDVVEGSLQDIASVMDTLSRGDLTHHIDADYDGTFGEVKEDVNNTLETLGRIVRQIRSASGLISSACGNIAASSGDVAHRTTHLAQELTEAAQQIDEMTKTVRENAAQAREADVLAANARTQAERGGEIVHEAVAAMGTINESSEQITNIIGVIDDIAFQTNLLALNAAVEAARAGEQGRGFAVVASEVRNLAQRSAAAAKEINSHISESMSNVRNGTQLVGDSGEALRKIVDASNQVSGIVNAIATAGEKQASRIEAVSANVMDMDASARASATLVEKSAEDSQDMKSKALDLEKLADYFTVDKPQADSAPRIAAA